MDKREQAEFVSYDEIKSNYLLLRMINHNQITAQIKPISEADSIKDFINLSKIDLTNPPFKKLEGNARKTVGLSNESRVGNKFIDYFTFEERLATKSRKGMNFYEFVCDLKYQARPYIKNLLVKQEHLKINELTKLYRIYSLHCGSVALFKPLKAIELYKRFNPSVAVLDPCMGWGGRMVGAVVAKVPQYIGIDLNVNLKEPYKKMIDKLNELTTGSDHGQKGTTNIETHFCDAVTFDYSKLSYDMILTSPPYYNIELYSCCASRTKKEWNEEFYRPLFMTVWKHLLIKGWMCLNISQAIYGEIFIEMFGLADEIIPMSLKVRPCMLVKNVTEFVYCWQKPIPKGPP